MNKSANQALTPPPLSVVIDFLSLGNAATYSYITEDPSKLMTYGIGKFAGKIPTNNAASARTSIVFDGLSGTPSPEGGR